MSRFYYLAADVELPVGVFGRKEPRRMRRKDAPLLDELPNGAVPLHKIMDLSHLDEMEVDVYDTREDAMGLVVKSLSDWQEGIRRHFRNAYVYEIGGTFCTFYGPDKKILYRHLGSYMNDSQAQLFEFYSCWSDEVELAKAAEWEFKRDAFKLEAMYEWENRHYFYIQK